MTLHMKQLFRLLLMMAGLFLAAPFLHAQSPSQSIFDYLSKGSNRGTVTIMQSSEIRALVGRRPDAFVTGAGNTKLEGEGYAKIRGYRIQVYSGNRPNSKSIAHSRERLVNELMPEYNSYILFKAPFWRLHVGNFLNYQEAQMALKEFRKTFPAFAREIIVVRDVVYTNRSN